MARVPSNRSVEQAREFLNSHLQDGILISPYNTVEEELAKLLDTAFDEGGRMEEDLSKLRMAAKPR